MLASEQRNHLAMPHPFALHATKKNGVVGNSSRKKGLLSTMQLSPVFYAEYHQKLNPLRSLRWLPRSMLPSKTPTNSSITTPKRTSVVAGGPSPQIYKSGHIYRYVSPLFTSAGYLSGGRAAVELRARGQSLSTNLPQKNYTTKMNFVSAKIRLPSFYESKSFP